MKRASGHVRHLVRVELVAAVAERGPHPWPSARKAAAELAERLGLGASTIRRALADWTLADEVALAIANHADPVSHPGIHPGSHPAPTEEPPANPLVPDPPASTSDAATPLPSTRHPLLSDAGAAVVPPASPGRRPREVRRSRFPGRCVLCLTELHLGAAFYLVPYDTGTAVYCLDHSALGLAMAQMFYDVSRGRPVADELELYVRPPRPHQ